MLSSSSVQRLSPKTWNIVDVGSIWMKEFASALAAKAITVAWEPYFSWSGAVRSRVCELQLENPPLRIRRFPLQRGYARSPISQLFPFEKQLLQLLRKNTPYPSTSPLICSTPFYAPLAEKWPGPVIYYSTDLTVAYAGVDSGLVKQLDRRLCERASAVCPNSNRIAEYFVQDAGCDPRKIRVVPNATREVNIALRPLLQPSSLPSEAAYLRRPIAGVIGNLAANMDWVFIMQSIRLTPDFNWLFVGPTEMPISDPQQLAARSWTRENALFVGSKPYAELQAYARAFDVAVLPYIRKEPTYSGSSTRFYEHLAACRPMIATRGFAELIEKQPLLTLVDTASELQNAFQLLRSQEFRDGLEEQRWLASKEGTWERRAGAMISTIAEC